MYRDDLAATHARAEQLQRELDQAQASQVKDREKIAAMTKQLASLQQALYRLGGELPQLGFRDAPRGGVILALGILSLLMCAFLGPVAWSMGNEELRRIDNRLVDPASRGMANAGRICGIVSTVLMILGAVFFISMLGLLAMTHG